MWLKGTAWILWTWVKFDYWTKKSTNLVELDTLDCNLNFKVRQTHCSEIVLPFRAMEQQKGSKTYKLNFTWFIYLKTKSVPLHFFLLQVPRFKQMSLPLKKKHSIKISGFVANQQAHVDPFCNGNTKRDRITLAFHNFTTLKKNSVPSKVPLKNATKCHLVFQAIAKQFTKKCYLGLQDRGTKKQKSAKRKLMLVLWMKFMPIHKMLTGFCYKLHLLTPVCITTP